jgi:hypothetical protein
MLHCIWTVPAIAAETKLDILVADLKAGSYALSATGEHWAEAKRSRDVLDELSSATVRWIIEVKMSHGGSVEPNLSIGAIDQLAENFPAVRQS